MAEYLAKYGGTVYKFFLGMAIPYCFSKERKFIAEDKTVAFKIINDQKLEIARNLFTSTISLDRLLETNEVPLN